MIPNASYVNDGEDRDWSPDMFMKFWKDFGVFPGLLSKAELAKVQFAPAFMGECHTL